MKNIRVIFKITIIIIFSFEIGLSQQSDSEKSNSIFSKAKETIGLLSNHNYSEVVGNYDSVMAVKFPLDKLKETWEGLIKQVGNLKKIGDIQSQKLQKYDIATVECEFENLPIDINISFNESMKISGLFFRQSQKTLQYQPPDYVVQDSFLEKEVKIGDGEWSLPGTLTLPKGKGPFPALVLVHGSGPQDQDETIGPNKCFKDIAWGLASKGIAVLRYDKRTKVHAQKMVTIKNRLTIKEETVDDAISASYLLKSIPEINKDKIFLLGHSLGGMMVPRIGKLFKELNGFIIMAGNSRPLQELIIEQYKYIFSLDSTISEEEQKELDKLKIQIENLENPNLSESTPDSCLPFSLPAFYWMDLIKYNQREEIKGIEKPILILQGGRDYQVTKVDFEGWKKALDHRDNVTFKFYPLVNHTFIEGTGQITPTEYFKPGHVSKEVVQDISSWIKIH